MKCFLNVGGGYKNNPVPDYYAGWRHDLLDIDPKVSPDVLLDARLLHTLPTASYDAVLCAHNLEHYYLHDALTVVRGFSHILKPGGFVDLRVPDLMRLMQHVLANNMDFDDVVYVSSAGPIRVRDMIYGFQPTIEKSGQDFFAHRNGFSVKSIANLFDKAGGFARLIFGQRDPFELWSYIFKTEPDAQLIKDLSLQNIYSPVTPVGQTT